ncbi:MAG: DUF2939 domain-containing protein [Gemmatimonadetes bacterium]|nr:DUF2939 domain-containing protein [Gemmatimonadota bacterium]
MSKRLIAAAAAVVVVLAAGFLYLHYRNSPRYALAQIRSAVERHDRLRFERYVDVDRFSTTLVDQLTGHIAAESFRQTSVSENGMGALGSALGIGLLERLKPAMVEAVRSSVRESVQNGSLAGLFSKPGKQGQVDLQRLGSTMGVGKDVFLGIGGIRQDGGTALVDLRVHPILLDTVLTVSLRMEKVDGTWRVVAPDNLTAYLATLSRLQAAKLAAVNAAARARLKELVAFGPVQVDARETSLLGTALRLHLTATNRGREPIEMLTLTFGDATSTSDLQSLAVVMEPGEKIAPGASRELDGFVDYNQFSDFHKHLRYGSVSVDDASAFYVETHAESVQLWSDWEEYAAHEASRPVSPPARAAAGHQAGVSRPSVHGRDG